MRWLLILSLLVPTTALAKTRVVATTTDIAALAREIGGDEIAVEAIAKGYQDPHYLDAKPSHMAKLRRADLLAYVGLELEVGWLPLLVKGARNPRLRAGEAGNLALHDGVKILEVPEGEVSRADGDVHPLGNPHYWLDPRNLEMMAGTMARGLSRIDPEHAGDFESRRSAFVQDLTARRTEWEHRAAALRGMKIVCYHKQWEYLFDWLGVEIVGYVENKAGIPPSPQHVGELEALIEREGIEVIVISNFFEPGPAESLAARTGARLLVLPPSVEGEDGLDDAYAHFEFLISRLVEALTGSGNGG